MKNIISWLLLAFILVGCSNNVSDERNSAGKKADVNKEEGLNKEDEKPPLPFDVNSFIEDLKKEVDLDPDEVDIYVVNVSEELLIANFNSLSENVLFLELLASYLDDTEDQINELIKELEEYDSSVENYSSTIKIDDVRIITTLIDHQVVISVFRGDWVEKSVEKELQE